VLQELYDRTMDPEEHLGVYKTRMYVQDVDDVAYHRYFSATLKQLAQASFSALTPGSVTCFQELYDRFVN